VERHSHPFLKNSGKIRQICRQIYVERWQQMPYDTIKQRRHALRQGVFYIRRLKTRSMDEVKNSQLSKHYQKTI
jgi:hypothetical protein